MKKQIIIIPLLFISLFLGAGLYWFGGQRHVKEKYIAGKIEAANYCTTKNDCALASVSACPFGCYILVNQSKVGEIKQLLDGYQSRCEYSCREIKGFDCIQNKCEIIK